MPIVNETRIFKGRDGWEACSIVKLDDLGLPGRVIRLHTDKWALGGLWSHAISARVEGASVIWEPFSDWEKKMFKEPKTRCTEKNVREMHARSLSVIEDLVAECVAFYQKKEAA